MLLGRRLCRHSRRLGPLHLADSIGESGWLVTCVPAVRTLEAQPCLCLQEDQPKLLQHEFWDNMPTYLLLSIYRL